MHLIPLLAQTTAEESPTATQWIDSIILVIREFMRVETFIFPAYWGILVASKILRSI